MYVIDTNKNAVANLTALINASNNSRWFPGQLVFGIPGTYSDTWGRNTKVDVSPASPDINKPTTELHYKRLGLLVNVATPLVDYSYDDTTTPDQLLAMVAQGLGVIADEIEFSEAFVSRMTSINVQPKANSLIYTGFAVRLALTRVLPPLSSLFKNNILNGFDAV